MTADSVENEAGIGAVVGCVVLALLAAYMWFQFAQDFARSMTTTCGEGCTQPLDPQVSLGIYLGLAVASTVFSAALLVVALIRRGSRPTGIRPPAP
jgi:Mg/Co/Ni transporter MgtE